MIKAVAFDWDGTIVDSMPFKARMFGKTLSECCGLDADKVAQIILRTAGQPLYLQFELALGRRLEPGEGERLEQDYYDNVGDERKLDMTPGTLEALQELKKSRLVFLISGLPTEHIKELARQREIEGYFTDFKGAPANKEENIKAFLAEHALKPEEFVLITDSVSDAREAKAAGVPFIGINRDKETIAELKRLGAKKVLPDMNGLVQVIDSL